MRLCPGRECRDRAVGEAEVGGLHIAVATAFRVQGGQGFGRIAEDPIGLADAAVPLDRADPLHHAIGFVLVDAAREIGGDASGNQLLGEEVRFRLELAAMKRTIGPTDPECGFELRVVAVLYEVDGGKGSCVQELADDPVSDFRPGPDGSVQVEVAHSSP